MITVTVFHNIAGSVEDNPVTISRRFLAGFEPTDPITPVFRYEAEPNTAGSYQKVLERAWYLFNVGDADKVEISLLYRDDKLRSLSVGDIISIECPHEIKWYSCAPIGWTEIVAPVENIVFRVDIHGTHTCDMDVRWRAE